MAQRSFRAGAGSASDAGGRAGVQLHVLGGAARFLGAGKARGGDREVGSIVADEAPVELVVVGLLDHELHLFISCWWWREGRRRPRMAPCRPRRSSDPWPGVPRPRRERCPRPPRRSCLRARPRRAVVLWG